MKLRRLIALLAGILLLWSGNAFAANCGGATACSCGDTVTSDYTLSANLSCTNAGPALTVGANDITIDLGTYTIDGDNTNTTIGVFCDGYDGFTLTGDSVSRGTIQNFMNYAGVLIVNASDVAISNIWSKDNGTAANQSFGFYIIGSDAADPSDNITLTNNKASGNSSGGFHNPHYVTNVTYNNNISTQNGAYFDTHGFSGHPYRQTFTGDWVEVLGSEKITAQNDRDFSGESIGNWVVVADGAGTCTYDGVNPGAEKVGKLTSSGDAYLYGSLSDSYMTLATWTFYEFSMNVYAPDANTLKRIRLRAAGFGNDLDLTSPTLVGDTWTPVSGYYLVQGSTTGTFRIGFYGNPADGDILYYDDITLKPATFRQSYSLTGAYVQDATNGKTLTENDGVTSAVGYYEWDVDTDNDLIYINVGADPNSSMSIMVADGNHGPVTYNGDISFDNYDDDIYDGGAYGGEGHGFSADDLASNYTYNNVLSYQNDGHGIMLNRGVGNSVYYSIAWANGRNGLTVVSGGTATIYNASIHGNVLDGLNIGANTTVTLKNSIISTNGDYGVDDDASSTVTGDYNDFYGNTTGARRNFSAGAHSIALAPLFVDAANGRFDLQVGSPCIDAGQ